MVVIYPFTRFSYAALTMDRVANNSAPIQTLVSENAWKATRATGRFSSCSAATARHTPMKITVVGLGAGPVPVGDARHLVAPRPLP